MTNTSGSVIIHGSQKIQPTHRLRLACIYVRQSSPSQVRDNKESLVNQYRLVESAQALGWSEATIRVIDADLGVSGRTIEGRLGFQELLTQVSLGQVGIIFGYEASRLARNNADWYHLLNIAAIRQTLVADNDGVYDPNHPNDRLLLGLKGAMSEFELHSIRQRMDAGRMNKVQRGELRQPLPTGYLRLKDGTTVKDPDAQVCHVIQIIFDKFTELGSASKVARYLRQNNVLVPRRQSGGVQHGELLWKPPSYAAIYHTLVNPTYAGAFAYGRTQVDPIRRIPGQKDSGRVHKPQAEWVHLQRDIYPAYISWEQFLANQEQLRRNYADFDQDRRGPQGAAREGKAILQGLVRCGGCGGRMHGRYTEVPKYACFQLPNHAGKGSCLHIVAHRIDEIVVNAFFQALQPAQLDALEALLTQQHHERHQLDQQWQQRLERAHYEASLAQRRYRSVDPDNRLVAATLEVQWEEQLQQLNDTQSAYYLFLHQQDNAPQITPDLRTQFCHICDTLPILWPQLANDHKKLLLRSLIHQVILTPTDATHVEVKIVWVSGHFSAFALLRTAARSGPTLPRRDELLERIHHDWQQGLTDRKIAHQLNNEGFRAYNDDRTLAWHTIRDLRLQQGWSVRPSADQTPPLVNGCYTPKGLAIACNTRKDWILNRIHDGTIEPALISRHAQQDCLLIQASPDLIEHLRHLAAQIRSRRRNKQPSPSTDSSAA